MAKYIIIDEVTDTECEWDTYVGGTLCHNKATKAIVDTEDILHAAEGGFHAAHLCGDHIERAYRLTSNNKKRAVILAGKSEISLLILALSDYMNVHALTLETDVKVEGKYMVQQLEDTFKLL